MRNEKKHTRKELRFNCALTLKLLDRYGMTRADLAREAGVYKQVIYHMMEGKVPHPSKRRAIAAALKMPIDSIWIPKAR